MAPLLKIIARFSDCLVRFSASGSDENAWLASSARDYLVHLIYAAEEREFQVMLRSGQMHGLTVLLVDAGLSQLIHTLPVSTEPADVARWLDSPGMSRRKLIAAMIVREPHRFPGLIEHLRDLSLLNELKTYIGYCPKTFQSEEDLELYVRYIINSCDYFADRLGSNLIDADDEFLATHFMRSLKVGGAYSAKGSLIEMAKAKARLIENYVRVAYPAEVVDRRPNPVRRPGPRRVGLLWYDVDRRTENIVGVASCRDFRRHGWEVTSIVLNERFSVSFNSTLKPDVEALSDAVLNLAGRSLVDNAAAIRALDLDFLLVMNNVTWGYSEHIALSSLRLARAQGVNFCAVVSTGFSRMDYWFSGELSERAAVPQAGYSEQLIKIPGTCLVFDKVDYPEITPLGDLRSEMDIPAEKFVYVSGANFYKLHPALTKTWMSILAAAPNSVLVLYPFNPNWDSAYPLSVLRTRLTAEMKAAGLTGRRIILAGPWKSAAPVTRLLTCADAYLDSFPHSGGLSSLDALARGTPVVTLRGETQRENQSSDMLTEFELDGLIADDADAYVRIATRLYADPEWAARVRLDLADSFARGSIFDAVAYSHKFGEAIAALPEMNEVNR